MASHKSKKANAYPTGQDESKAHTQFADSGEHLRKLNERRLARLQANRSDGLNGFVAAATDEWTTYVPILSLRQDKGRVPTPELKMRIATVIQDLEKWRTLDRESKQKVVEATREAYAAVMRHIVNRTITVEYLGKNWRNVIGELQNLVGEE